MRMFLAAILSALSLTANVGAQDDIWDILPPDIRATLDEQADQLHALTFGWCFNEVRGTTLRSDYADPYEEAWLDVVSAENSNGTQYAQPRTSPDQAFFVDLFPNGQSCYIQLDSLSTPYIMQTIVAELLAIQGLELVDVDQSEVGRNSRHFMIPARGDGYAALMQIHAYYSPQSEIIVIILRRHIP